MKDHELIVKGRTIAAVQNSGNLNLMEAGIKAYDEISIYARLPNGLLGGSKNATFRSSTSSSNSEEEKDQLFDSHDGSIDQLRRKSISFNPTYSPSTLPPVFQKTTSHKAQIDVESRRESIA